jgi:hypothetical protein
MPQQSIVYGDSFCTLIYSIIQLVVLFMIQEIGKKKWCSLDVKMIVCAWHDSMITGTAAQMCWEPNHDSRLNNIYCGQDQDTYVKGYIVPSTNTLLPLIAAPMMWLTETATKHMIIRHWEMTFVDTIWKSTHTIERVFQRYSFPLFLRAEVLLTFLFS